MKKFAVIGLGNFGFHAAKALFEDGNEIIAIDDDKSRVQAIDPYATEAIVLDATDKEALSKGLPDIQLYNMNQDAGEQTNLQAEHPEVVSKLIQLLKTYVTNGRSTPGKAGHNDLDHIDLWKRESQESHTP